MTLASQGFLHIGDCDLEYRMIGPAPQDAPTIVMLHEGLGSAALWGDFPQSVQAATGMGVFVYSRAGYGASTSVTLPRPLDYMSREALDVLPPLLDAIGFQRGVLLGHSDGASIAAIYAGATGDHRVRGVVLIAPHFVVEEVSVASITGIRKTYETTDLRAKLARWHHTSITPSTAGMTPGLIPTFVDGTSANISPTFVFRSQFCKVRTINMGRSARSRSRRRSVIAPSM
jgi:pimeloyl-ACP methyl ester carboxylesterase